MKVGDKVKVLYISAKDPLKRNAEILTVTKHYRPSFLEVSIKFMNNDIVDKLTIDISKMNGVERAVFRAQKEWYLFIRTGSVGCTKWVTKAEYDAATKKIDPFIEFW